jgi:hypothetical protein
MTKTMCTCADKIDEKLAERNTRLTRAFVFSPRHPDNPNIFVETEQVEKGRGKQKATKMFASYCPFCGEEYPTEAA